MHLPERSIAIRRISLGEDEKDFYESVYKMSAARFDSYVEKGTLLHNYAHVFELLSRLRQACNHPYLVLHRPGSQDDGPKHQGSAHEPCGVCAKRIQHNESVVTLCRREALPPDIPSTSSHRARTVVHFTTRITIFGCTAMHPSPITCRRLTSGITPSHCAGTRSTTHACLSTCRAGWGRLALAALPLSASTCGQVIFWCQPVISQSRHLAIPVILPSRHLATPHHLAIPSPCYPVTSSSRHLITPSSRNPVIPYCGHTAYMIQYSMRMDRTLRLVGNCSDPCTVVTCEFHGQVGQGSSRGETRGVSARERWGSSSFSTRTISRAARNSTGWSRALWK